MAGLAAGLSAVEGADTYEFVGSPAVREELLPFIASPASFVVQAAAERSPTLVRISRTRPGHVAVRVRHRLLRDTPYTVRRAPDVIESGGYDVVHFPTQVGEITDRPSIYQPWDLQHLHFPHFFTGEQLRSEMPSGADAVSGRPLSSSRRSSSAPTSSTHSGSTRHGSPSSRLAFPRRSVLLRHPPARRRAAVCAVPRASMAAQEPCPSARCDRAPPRSELDISLVCPGQPNVRFRDLRTYAADLGLDGVVHFPGYVRDDELALLYRRSPLSRVPVPLRGLRLSRSRSVRRGSAGRVLLDVVSWRACGRCCRAVRPPVWSRSRRRFSRCGATMRCGRHSPRGAMSALRRSLGPVRSFVHALLAPQHGSPRHG